MTVLGPCFWRFWIPICGDLCDSRSGSSALGDAMAKPRDNRQKDLLRPALEAIIDHSHPLVRLACEIDWGFLDGRFASVCTPGAGQPPLPTRLVAGLFNPSGSRLPSYLLTADDLGWTEKAALQ